MSGASVLFSIPRLIPIPSFPVPRSIRYEYDAERFISLSKPILSLSTSKPTPLFIPKGETGALILKTVVEGAPLNPTHCCRVKCCGTNHSGSTCNTRIISQCIEHILTRSADPAEIKPAVRTVLKKEMQYLVFSSLYLQVQCTLIERVK